MTVPLLVLMTHFVGDFLLQSDWMATNKSRDWRALLWHTTVYSVCFVPFYGVGFALVTWCLHTVVDAGTSRATSALWTHGERHWFFVVIGADQLIHAACLAVTPALVEVLWRLIAR